MQFALKSTMVESLDGFKSIVLTISENKRMEFQFFKKSLFIIVGSIPYNLFFCRSISNETKNYAQFFFESQFCNEIKFGRN